MKKPCRIFWKMTGSSSLGKPTKSRTNCNILCTLKWMEIPRRIWKSTLSSGVENPCVPHVPSYMYSIFLQLYEEERDFQLINPLIDRILLIFAGSLVRWCLSTLACASVKVCAKLPSSPMDSTMSGGRRQLPRTNRFINENPFPPSLLFCFVHVLNTGPAIQKYNFL